MKDKIQMILLLFNLMIIYLLMGYSLMIFTIIAALIISIRTLLELEDFGKMDLEVL